MIRNKKGQAVKKMIAIVLLLLVIATVLIFIYREGILDWFRNMGGFTYEDADKEIDMSDEMDRVLTQRSCPERIAKLDGTDIKFCGDEMCREGNLVESELLFKNNVVLASRGLNDKIGDLKNSLVVIFPEIFEGEGVYGEVQDELPSYELLKNLDGTYIWKEYFCRKDRIEITSDRMSFTFDNPVVINWFYGSSGLNKYSPGREYRYEPYKRKWEYNLWGWYSVNDISGFANPRGEEGPMQLAKDLVGKNEEEGIEFINSMPGQATLPPELMVEVLFDDYDCFYNAKNSKGDLIKIKSEECCNSQTNFVELFLDNTGFLAYGGSNIGFMWDARKGKAFARDSKTPEDFLEYSDLKDAEPENYEQYFEGMDKTEDDFKNVLDILDSKDFREFGIKIVEVGELENNYIVKGSGKLKDPTLAKVWAKVLDGRDSNGYLNNWINSDNCLNKGKFYSCNLFGNDWKDCEIVDEKNICYSGEEKKCGESCLCPENYQEGSSFFFLIGNQRWEFKIESDKLVKRCIIVDGSKCISGMKEWQEA